MPKMTSMLLQTDANLFKALGRPGIGTSFFSIKRSRLVVCLLEWALNFKIQLWIDPCNGFQPLTQGVGVFVTPLLPHLQRERGIWRDPMARSILTPHTAVF